MLGLVLLIIGFLVVQCALMIWDERRLRRLFNERKGESICTFARALDYRHLDTRIIRGVYEGLREMLPIPVPLRPTDHLEKDLRIDSEDLDDFAEEIAKRCSRTLDGAESNPYYGKVQAVGDLIQFLFAQPQRDERHTV